MKLIEVHDYFEDYAKSHILLKHNPDQDDEVAFVAAQHEDESAEEMIKGKKKDLILVFMPYNKKGLPVRAENYSWGKNLIFLVLKRLGKSPDGRSIIEAQSLCEEVIDDLCTRFIDDRARQFYSTDYETFFQEPVGPIATNWYGMIGMMVMADYFDQTVKPARWS